MSIRVVFYLCHAGGLVDEFMAGPLDEFEAWCADQLLKFPHRTDPRMLPLLRDVRDGGRAVLHATTASKAAAVDRLMDAYFCDFCCFVHRGLLREADGSSLRMERYEGLLDAARGSTTGNIAWRLWNFMFTGRPVERDASAWPYVLDNDFRLSWWTAEEVAVLQEAFEITAPPPGADEDAVECAREAIGRAYEDGLGLCIQLG